MEVVFAPIMPKNVLCVLIYNLEVYGGRVRSHIAQEQFLELDLLMQGFFPLGHSVLAAQECFVNTLLLNGCSCLISRLSWLGKSKEPFVNWMTMCLMSGLGLDE